MNAAEYTSMLRALLPTGEAWTAEPGTSFAGLLSGLAVELSRIDTRAAALLEEADGGTTTECVAEWESTLGLPGECEAPATIEGRRAAIVAKLTANDSPTLARVLQIGTLLGYTLTIKEYREPFTCISDCNDELYTDAWAFVLDVTTPTGASNALLECLLEDMAPLHTMIRVFFT
jgi:uncharacterized protein YmfQ (DUF2313 family)